MNQTHIIRLIQLHILTAFFSNRGIDVVGRSLEIGELLTRILDISTVNAVSVLKDMRHFGASELRINVGGHPRFPTTVVMAVRDGLDRVEAQYCMYDDKDRITSSVEFVDYFLVTIPSETPIDLLEAKRMFDLLRSMNS